MDENASGSEEARYADSGDFSNDTGVDGGDLFADSGDSFDGGDGGGDYV